jgi:hypothetical protein
MRPDEIDSGRLVLRAIRPQVALLVVYEAEAQAPTDGPDAPTDRVA